MGHRVLGALLPLAILALPPLAAAQPAGPAPPPEHASSPSVTLSIDPACVVPSGAQILDITPRDFGEGHVIAVRLTPGSLARLEARARCRRVGLGLFLDGWFLKGATPVVDGRGGDTLRFVLQPADEDRLAWKHLLKDGNGSFTRRVEVEVGLEDGSERASEAAVGAGVTLRLFPRGKASGAAFLFLVILTGTLIAGARTPLLRDAGPRPAPTPRDPRGLGTFSFARVQMLWWTVFAAFALLLLWAVTGTFHPPSASLLALMGVSAGTYVLAAVIDDNKAGLQPGGPAAVGPSEGILNDILSDRNGYSLHRVQMLIWTAVSSAVFLGALLNTLAVPEIDPTMLGLMGLSSGTYLGFKLPEKPT